MFTKAPLVNHRCHDFSAVVRREYAGRKRGSIEQITEHLVKAGPPTAHHRRRCDVGGPHAHCLRVTLHLGETPSEPHPRGGIATEERFVALAECLDP